MAFNQQSILKKGNPQDADVTFPSPPTDTISSIAVNGNIQTNSTVLVAGSWDNSVSKYLIYPYT